MYRQGSILSARYTRTENIPLPNGGVLSGIASARRSLRLGIFARCGKILMAAEPGNNLPIVQFQRPLLSPIGIKILQQGGFQFLAQQLDERFMRR